MISARLILALRHRQRPFCCGKRDVATDIPQAINFRHETTLSNFVTVKAVRQCMRRGADHAVRHLGRTGNNGAEAKAGKDKNVVGLADALCPPRIGTGSNGLPVATNALAPVQRSTSSGIASLISVGFDIGRITGLSQCLAIALTTRSSNAPNCPDVPTSVVGLYALNTLTRLCAVVAHRAQGRLPVRPATRARLCNLKMIGRAQGFRDCPLPARNA